MASGFDAITSSARFKMVAARLATGTSTNSPSSKRKDAIYKRSKYEDEGVASYWIVDPEEPSILALDLVDGRYEIVGQVSGDESITLEKPFPVTLVPSALIR